jgi:hypothetical protein
VRDVLEEAAGKFAASNGRPALLVIDGADFLTDDLKFVKKLVGLAKARGPCPLGRASAAD